MKDWLKKIKVAVAVGRVVMNPDSKAGKVLEKIDKGSDIAQKALDGISLAKELIKK